MKKPDVYNPYITVSFDDKGRVYYEILYYDVDDEQWHTGYGSYDLYTVKKWLKEELNVLDTEMKFVPRDRANYGLEKNLIKKVHPEYSDKEVEAYIKGYEEKELEIRDEANENKAIETGLKLVSQPCTLCGNNCQVSLSEQFKVRNGLCKEREQNIISTEVDGLYLNIPKED